MQQRLGLKKPEAVFGFRRIRAQRRLFFEIKNRLAMPGMVQDSVPRQSPDRILAWTSGTAQSQSYSRRNSGWAECCQASHANTGNVPGARPVVFRNADRHGHGTHRSRPSAPAWRCMPIFPRDRRQAGIDQARHGKNILVWRFDRSTGRHNISMIFLHPGPSRTASECHGRCAGLCAKCAGSPVARYFKTMAARNAPERMPTFSYVIKSP